MIIKALLSNDKEMMKQNLQKLFVYFIKVISSDIDIPFPTYNVIWNFAFLNNPQIDPVDLQQLIMGDLATTISESLKSAKPAENAAATTISFTQSSVERFFGIILKI